MSLDISLTEIWIEHILKKGRNLDSLVDEFFQHAVSWIMTIQCYLWKSNVRATSNPSQQMDQKNMEIIYNLGNY